MHSTAWLPLPPTPMCPEWLGPPSAGMAALHRETPSSFFTLSPPATTMLNLQ